MRSLLTAFLASMSIAGAANAANLILDASFEGAAAAWTFSGTSGLTGQPYTGLASAYVNGPTSCVPCNNGDFSQTVATTIGQKYLVSFWLSDNGAFGDLTAAFANSVGYSYSGNGTANYAWVQHSFTATATQASSTFAFNGYNLGGTWFIDDVSVTPVASGGVPEPSTWTMMILGFAGAGAAMRRARRARLSL